MQFVPNKYNASEGVIMHAGVIMVKMQTKTYSTVGQTTSINKFTLILLILSKIILSTLMAYILDGCPVG